MSCCDKAQFAEVQYGFDVRTTAPIDRRLILSKKEMRDLEVTFNGKKINLEEIMPVAYFALCKDNGMLYKYCSYDCDCDCDNDEKKIYPYWIGDKFKLIDRVVDVMAIGADGKEYSVLDASGKVVVATPEQINELKKKVQKNKEDIATVTKEFNALKKEAIVDTLTYIVLDDPHGGLIRENKHSTKQEGGIAVVATPGQVYDTRKLLEGKIKKNADRVTALEDDIKSLKDKKFENVYTALRKIKGYNEDKKQTLTHDEVGKFVWVNSK